MKRWLRTPADGARAVLRVAMASSPKYGDAVMRKDLVRRAAAAVGLG